MILAHFHMIHSGSRLDFKIGGYQISEMADHDVIGYLIVLDAAME